MGRVDEAMSVYARALSIDRQSQSALVGLARLHLGRGERELARKILLQAAEFHPQDDMIENMLVALDLPRPWQKEPIAIPVEKSVASSIVAGEKTAETVAGKPIPTATLAEIYAKQGLTDQAIRVYGEILRLEPDNAVAARRLGELRGEPVAAPVPAVSLPPVDVTTSSSPIQARAPRQPLEIFESWLQAIQIGRAHVQ
jgi:tetratricopeptide (TPR) repeat protein